ncbi:hypothetical protein [Desulfurivibrio alkaliphilus]|uniref:Uncharacterized protein n=1 Tax=Desulfurivibrio alkaliphilus (strain DSM 19089 / UNIQEM U267 / AHT2) TaxID=589865 RepID=D6Z487_DESAT|nr:hypothetical protein [Desulfurivibrio alkaliphilus]ADH86362.1 conserved hypothetical protein [Desulfurivibrio alkaliphilus AHT 2]
MSKKNKNKNKGPSAEKSEEAMIGGLIEGSPEAVGVAVLRLACGCRKMAAVDKTGEPASKVVIYRDNALNVCQQCQEDNGAFVRVQESFIHWINPAPAAEEQQKIRDKVFGTVTTH